MATIEIGPLDLKVTHQRANGPTDRCPGTQPPITRGAPQSLSRPLVLMALRKHRLGHASGEPLPQRPDRLTDLGQGRLSLGQLGFDLVEPRVKALMELLAQGLALS